MRVETLQTNDRPRPGKQVEQHCVIHIGRGADAVTMPADYLLYLPPDYTSRSKWPLMIYLHGVGSRGQDLNLVRRESPVALVEQGRKVQFRPPRATMSGKARVGITRSNRSSA